MMNRARQSGKTTTLIALEKYLQRDYHVVFVNFQIFGKDEFSAEHIFALSFADTFLRLLAETDICMQSDLQKTIERIQTCVEEERSSYRLRRLLEDLSRICAYSDKPLVLILAGVYDIRTSLHFVWQLCWVF